MLQIESLQPLDFPRPHIACPNPSTGQDENANSPLKLHSKHKGVQVPFLYGIGHDHGIRAKVLRALCYLKHTYDWVA